VLSARHVPAGTRLLDLGEPGKGGPAVRVLVVQHEDAIRGGTDGSPVPLDAATLAWEFFRGALGKPGAPAP